MRTLRTASWAGLAAVAAGLLWLYAKLFAVWPVNADQANVLFAAAGMAAGNWRLHGWELPPDNFWGLELPLTALLWAVTHNGVLSLRLAAALAWALLGAVCLALTRKPRLGPVLLFVGVLWLPPVAKGSLLIIADLPVHVLTTAGSLGAIGLAERLLRAPPGARLWTASAYGLVVLDASASDPMFWVLGAGPVLAALVLAGHEPGAPRLRLGAATIALLAAGRALVALNAATGGFHTGTGTITFAPFFGLPSAAGLTCKAILDALNCDPFGYAVHARLAQLLRLPLLYVFAAPVIQVARGLRARARPDFMDTALGLVIIADLAFMLLSNVVMDDTAMRFFIPGWAAGAVLAARRRRFSGRWVLYYAALAVVALGTDLQAAARKAPPAFAPVDEHLAACLETLDLPFGYGTYWRSSSVTLATQGRVVVRALDLDGAGNVAPMFWLADRAWYARKPASGFFVITQAGDAMLPRDVARAALGAPAASLDVDDTTIDVYGALVAPHACAGAQVVSARPKFMGKI